MSKIIKAISNDKLVRYYVSDITDIVKEIQIRQNPSPEVLIILAKTVGFFTIYASSMLSKNEEITLILSTNGSIGKVYATANNKNEIKIFATNNYAISKNKDINLDLIGNSGTLTIIKDLQLKEKYSGVSEIVKGDIVNTFSNFMNSSEQLPSALATGISFNEDGSVKSSGSYMAQLMPGYTDDTIEYVEMSTKISPNPNELFSNYSLEEALEFISRGEYKILSEENAMFKCNCKKERFISKVKSLSNINLNDIFDNKEEIEIICEYCKNKYIISKGDIYGK